MDLEKFGRTARIDRRKCCQRSSTNDRRQFHTERPPLCTARRLRVRLRQLRLVIQNNAITILCDLT